MHDRCVHAKLHGNLYPNLGWYAAMLMSLADLTCLSLHWLQFDLLMLHVVGYAIRTNGAAARDECD